jgi:hypothetical protein
MWLGPIDPAMVLSVVDDRIWFFMDGNLDGGYPLIGRSAPATDSANVRNKANGLAAPS